MVAEAPEVTLEIFYAAMGHCVRIAGARADAGAGAGAGAAAAAAAAANAAAAAAAAPDPDTDPDTDPDPEYEYDPERVAGQSYSRKICTTWLRLKGISVSTLQFPAREVLAPG